MSDLDLVERLRAAITEVPDFPREGVLFRDLTTLFSRGDVFKAAIDTLAAAHRTEGIDQIVAVESRGFIIGGALAYAMEVGFVPVRKKGKLPRRTLSVSYTLEYGEDVLEIHADAFRKGERVLVVDDLLATGGTAAATVSLVEQLGGVVVGIDFLVELEALGGAQQLGGRPHVSLIRF
ncbi:MAG TPA: adenine phosphoribosyltransferase [Candidatus Dormibacteraeota bacterium]|jgi:adenine phosphoribosyltransferase|nr:adenine phosphoribosyltransferase [Candidatus Dormibacteraeota bacterium]